MPMLILMIIVCIIVALFAIQNATTVWLNFVFWTFPVSLVIVILGSFLFGLIVAMCFMLYMKAKHYLHDKKMKEQIQNLTAENERLTERINMLQHTQMLHNEASEAKNAVPKRPLVDRTMPASTTEGNNAK